jgi:hypothetical protein
MNQPQPSPAGGDLAEALKHEARRLGFDPVGIASAAGSDRLQLRNAALDRWLAAGHHGSMAWMEDPRRRQIERLLPGVRSLLAVGLSYYVHHRREPGSLKVARYGWGRDYHRGDFAACVAWLAPVRHLLSVFGGSHAQRDAWQRTLLVAALRSGETGFAQVLVRERLAERPDSVWSQARLDELDALSR